MTWFSRKPTQHKYVEAAVTVASNLYLHTIPGAEDAPAVLQFSLQDSRYRYLVFCFSTLVTAALAYDEKKLILPDALIEGCLEAARIIALQNPEGFFDEPARYQDSVENTSAYFQEFLKHWSQWAELEKEGRNEEVWDLICSMVHTTESAEPLCQTDTERLGKLALEIDCRMPTMRGAFVELADR